jgi:hypothetical protein
MRERYEREREREIEDNQSEKEYMWEQWSEKKKNLILKERWRSR